MSTQPLMKHEVVLPVIVDGYHWACNQDRMWNLNELHKELELPSAKEPGQWRSSVRTLLDQDANLHVAHGGSTPGTWATEEAAIAYAMWVSPDFYLKVIRAFIALRNDKVSPPTLIIKSQSHSICVLLPAVSLSLGTLSRRQDAASGCR